MSKQNTFSKINSMGILQIFGTIGVVAILLAIYQHNTNIDISDGASFFKKYYIPLTQNGLEKLMHFKHECAHAKIVEQEKLLGQPEQAYDATLQGTDDVSNVLPVEKDYKSIRITMDYSNLSGNTPSTLNFIQHSIVPAIVSFFSESVKVQRLTQPIKVDTYYKDNLCGAAKIVIPKEHFTTGVANTDLLYYVKIFRENSGTLAYASYCPQADTFGLASGRPTVAFMNINLNHLEEDLKSKDPMLLAKWIFICIHEVTHSFVFSPNYFDKFLLEPNPVKTINGKSVVVAPSVVKIGKAYFGCNDLTSLPLENEGGRGTMGAHWERKVFGNEIMTGSQMYDSVFSKFTFAMFTASGWYKMTDYMAGALTWGYNEGCDFVSNACPTNSYEFCKVEGSRCSYDYTGSGYCSNSDELSDKCKYWDSFSNTHCTFPDANSQTIFKNSGGSFGPSARCFETDIAKAAKYTYVTSLCLESYCEFKDGVQIKFKVAGTEYSCSESTKSVTIPKKGTVKCPDLLRFCFSPSACPNSCTGRGVCRLGKCHCYAGFSGSDCSITSAKI